MFTPGPCAVYNVQWTMDVSAKHLLSAESQTAICYLLAIGYVLYTFEEQHHKKCYGIGLGTK